MTDPLAPTIPAPVVLTPLTRFDKAIRFTMQNEDGFSWDHDNGEFTNDPRDPGGATMWGIVKTEYESFLNQCLTVDEVEKMPRDTAVEIYNRNFWLPIRGDNYSSDAAAIAIFDTAVNKGLGGCMVILSDCLHNHFAVRYGDSVIMAVNSMPVSVFLSSFEAATARYIDRRIAQYPNMEWARKGWMNRAQRLLGLNS